ncbi:hypothetical protein LMH66_06220 [Shewanella sp. 10N.7]|uniref:hypothetical protein n=1 Tax=Shewanella sp. 10N.7 TaxID=2885093 RepID=UPI001E45F67B|nr:hypothetical protein [Shewanella sp. 10N.7]MCC4832223.1 hypothetical protein [Shewanella sp. 10N.7]
MPLNTNKTLILLRYLFLPWKAYIRWCDKMGLTLENKRSCAPRIEEPQLNVDILAYMKKNRIKPERTQLDCNNNDEGTESLKENLHD